MDSTKRVLIIGAGCFGVSTALHLLSEQRQSHLGAKASKYDVTVLDRSNRLPAPDAASTDLNKGSCSPPSIFIVLTLASSVTLLPTVVRSSYHDVFYTRLAREAIATWKDSAAWGDCYRE